MKLSARHRSGPRDRIPRAAPAIRYRNRLRRGPKCRRAPGPLVLPLLSHVTVSKNHANGTYSPKADAKVAITRQTAKQSRHFFQKTKKVFAFVYKIREIGNERSHGKRQKGHETTTTGRKNIAGKQKKTKKEGKRKQKGEEINKKRRKTSKTGDFELNYP